MGSTAGRVRGGAEDYRDTKGTFGVVDARRTEYADLGASPSTFARSKTIQLAVRTGRDTDIVFTFKLGGPKNDTLVVTAFDKENNDKCTVRMNAKNPTLDRGAKGNVSMMRQMLNKTTSGISEASFNQISQQLQANDTLKNK